MKDLLSKVRNCVAIVGDIIAILAIVGEACDLITKRLDERKEPQIVDNENK